MKIIETFEEYNYKSQEERIKNINSMIFFELDPYDSIAGGECHDIALIAFIFSLDSKFLKNPKICWTSNHAWVEGEYLDIPCVLDLVAVNQLHLGDAFKTVKDKENIESKYYKNPKITNDPNKYIDKNSGVNISIQDAQFGAEELNFLK